MRIKLSDIAFINSKKKVSFKGDDSCIRQENFFKYLYDKGIRYYNSVYCYYQKDDKTIDHGELDNLIIDWLAKDIDIDQEYSDYITPVDVCNAFCRDSIPHKSPIFKRVLSTGQIGYTPDYRHENELERKIKEIKILYELLPKEEIDKLKEEIKQEKR